MSMENSFFFALLTMLLLLGCAPEQKQTDSLMEAKGTKKRLSTKGIDEVKRMLHDGDIVLRTGNDVISSLFAQLNKTNKTYSHCGIAFSENGQWFVYHSIGGEDNPDEKLRKDPFEKFVASNHNTGYAVCRYPMSSIESEKLLLTVTDFYDLHIPFDMQFDLKSDDRIYGAEMVYKEFNIALDTSGFFTTTIHRGFEYVSTDNIFVNNNARILCRIVY